MGRKSFDIEEIEQLKKMLPHSINLCEVCMGCEWYEEVKKLDSKYWAEKRQGGEWNRQRCNSFRPNPKKRKIMPKFNGDS